MIVFILRGVAQLVARLLWEQEAAKFESRHSDTTKSHDTALEMAIASWLYLLHKRSENAGLCVFLCVIGAKLLTEQTELNRELCTALHCSTRDEKCYIVYGAE